MINKFLSLIISLSLMCMMTACSKSSKEDFEDASNKFIVTVHNSLSTAASVYNVFMEVSTEAVRQQKITEEQYQKVLSIGEKYYNSYQVAVSALASYVENKDVILESDVVEKIQIVIHCIADMETELKELGIDLSRLTDFKLILQGK